MKCNVCSGNKLFQRCGSDTVMTARVKDNVLIVKATYNDTKTVPSTSALRIKMDYCFKCKRKLEEEQQ